MTMVRLCGMVSVDINVRENVPAGPSRYVPADAPAPPAAIMINM